MQRVLGVIARKQVFRPALARAFTNDPFKDRGSAAENEWAKREEGSSR